MKRVAGWVVLVLLVGACGDGGDDTQVTSAGDDGDGVELVYRMGDEIAGDGDSVDRLVQILEARLGALGVADPSIEVVGNTLRVTLPARAGARSQDIADILTVTAQFRFRPVLLQVPLSEGEVPPMSVTPPEDDLAEATVVLDEPGEYRYQLGPSELSGSIIEGARVQLSPDGTWQVALELTSDGIDGFNKVAAQCYATTASCPTGQLALVLDSEVQVAPLIQTGTFERDAIVITGEFSEDEAKELALVLRYGALPTSLGLVARS